MLVMELNWVIVKKIKLTKGKFTLVDNCDFKKLNQWKWYCTSHNYAARRIAVNKRKSKMLYMHRVILNIKDGFYVDHKNTNSLDNRRANLRICTKGQNQFNRTKSKTNTSGYKGVSKTRSGKWRACISINDKTKYLGVFAFKKDAALAYNKAALEYHKEFVKLNEVQ